MTNAAAAFAGQVKEEFLSAQRSCRQFRRLGGVERYPKLNDGGRACRRFAGQAHHIRGDRPYGLRGEHVLPARHAGTGQALRRDAKQLARIPHTVAQCGPARRPALRAVAIAHGAALGELCGALCDQAVGSQVDCIRRLQPNDTQQCDS